MSLETNNSSVYKLKYKLVMPVKIEGTLNAKVEGELTEVFMKISKKHGIECISVKSDEVSVEVVFKAKPNIMISKFVNSYKSTSSRKMRKLYSDKLEGNEFWVKGYLLLTLGNEENEIVDKYKRGNKIL